MYSGGSGLSIDIHLVDIELSYDVLSPLPIVLSKHFNHPHPYIEIATAISDYIRLHYITLHYIPKAGSFMTCDGNIPIQTAILTMCVLCMQSF